MKMIVGTPFVHQIKPPLEMTEHKQKKVVEEMTNYGAFTNFHNYFC